MLKSIIRRGGASLAAAAAAAAVTTLVPAPAHAASCSPTVPSGVTCSTSYSSGSKVTTIKSGDGDTLRAAFYDSQLRFSGDRILYYGGSSCSSSTTDTDFKLSFMPDAWNDKVSSIEDFHACDVNLFWDNNWGGSSTGYQNYGDDQNGGGAHLGVTWSNDASSFKIS